MKTLKRENYETQLAYGIGVIVMAILFVYVVIFAYDTLLVF
jgi:cbb3-type cytochrome oxidase subunit 3